MMIDKRECSWLASLADMSSSEVTLEVMSSTAVFINVPAIHNKLKYRCEVDES